MSALLSVNIVNCTLVCCFQNRSFYRKTIAGADSARASDSRQYTYNCESYAAYKSECLTLNIKSPRNKKASFHYGDPAVMK